MMKKLLFLLLIITAIGDARSQFPVAVDVVYDFIKSNSIHRQQVNWGQIDKQFASAIATAHNLNDTMNAFVLVLEALDDVHSQLYLNHRYYGYWRATDETSSARLMPFIKMAKATTGQIKCDLLEQQYAYVRVPGFEAYGSEAVNGYAKALRDSIDQMNRKKVRGFILDLRLNMGGNVYPMLSGLGQLLGEGEIAYEVDISDTIVRTWKIQNGNFVMNDFPLTNMEATGQDHLDELPVVILIGPVTASSGSATAIAFKGRKNTVFIGERTAEGYTTSNGYFQFAPNLFMNFAVAYVADRDMRLYPAAVGPDFVVEQGDDFENLIQDQKINRALLWLKGL